LCALLSPTKPHLQVACGLVSEPVAVADAAAMGDDRAAPSGDDAHPATSLARRERTCRARCGEVTKESSSEWSKGPRLSCWVAGDPATWSTSSNTLRFDAGGHGRTGNCDVLLDLGAALAATLFAATLFAATHFAATLFAATLFAATLFAATLFAATLFAATLLAATLFAATLFAVTLMRRVGLVTAVAASPTPSRSDMLLLPSMRSCIAARGTLMQDLSTSNIGAWLSDSA